MDTNPHPGRECSPDCAEFGCAEWTACDPAVSVEARKAAALRSSIVELHQVHPREESALAKGWTP